MIVVRQYFFRLKFKHVIQEQQRQSLLQRTMSRVATTRTQPLSAIKRRFSTILRQPTQEQEPVRFHTRQTPTLTSRRYAKSRLTPTMVPPLHLPIPICNPLLRVLKRKRIIIGNENSRKRKRKRKRKNRYLISFFSLADILETGFA